MSIFRRLHTLGGIFIAPLIFIAAFSGLFYAFAPTIESKLYSHELTASGKNPQALSKQIEIAQAKHPDLPLAGVRTNDDPSKTTRVLFADDSLASASYKHAVFVDPGTLEIKGDLIQYGSSASLPFRTWLSNGHKSLWLGEPGRIYAEVAASWLAPLALSGLFLWWSMRQKQKQARKPKSSSSRATAVRQHKTIGVWIAVGMLFLGASGLSWSLVAGDNISTLRQKLSWQTPSVSTSLDGGAASTLASPHAHHHDDSAKTNDQTIDYSHIDHVEMAARDAGLTGILEIKPPKDATSAWSASVVRQPFTMHNDAVAIDPHTMDITSRLNFSDWPVAAQLTAWAIQLHMGTLFGLYSQIALGLLAAGILALIVLGYVMWFKRGRGRAVGSIPRPVSWSTIPMAARVGIVVLALIYSAIAPLFLVSAFALYAIDWVWRWRKQKI